jgi:hypothetical protein
MTQEELESIYLTPGEKRLLKEVREFQAEVNNLWTLVSEENIW